jgi:hypothetical protein
MMNPAHDIIGLLEARASSGRRAFRFVDDLFDCVVDALRRNARFTGDRFALELPLADARRDAETALFVAMRGQVSIDDALDAVRACLGGEP